MAGNIFINYRREESGHVAGRLHDSLAPTFGRNKLFMDVDNIPVGRDFEEYLKSQVAACDAMLAIIGPNWLAAKDETGKRRLDAAARQAESEWLEALAAIGKAQVEEVGATQRAEMVSDDLLQRWWRPTYALELSLLECPSFALTLLHALWSGHEAGINGFASLTSLLMAYFGARFGVLGIYVNGRSREKQACATGHVQPSVIDQVFKALVKKK